MSIIDKEKIKSIAIAIERNATIIYDIFLPIIWIEVTILMVAYLRYKNAQSIDYLTGFLVIITAYYAWQTNNMAKEMKLVRQYQFIPALKIEPTTLYIGKSFDIEIKNIGFGPAKDIRGVIRIEPNGEEVKIFYPLLYPKEKFALLSPFTKAKNTEDAKKFKNVILDVTYMDIINNRTEGYDEFILEDIDKIKNDSYQRDKIVEELKRLGSNLVDIKSAISSQRR